ncbi:MAG: transcriptional regulator [Lactobacillus johnsonii]|nr:transcriptional regulator [Lactobacillus johnsonii]
MASDHNFEELEAPAKTAEELHISVATLRKYSLIVEKVTGNKDYYERTKQKSRLYSAKDIEDLKAFRALSKNADLTLQEAARQIFAVSNKKTEEVKKEAKTQKPVATNTATVDADQVVKLLTMLQNTIASQNKAIEDLQKQVARVEAQNKKLIDRSHQLAEPESDDSAEKQEANKDQEAAKEITEEQKSEQEAHEEILRKARENEEKRRKQQVEENIHRTLAQMQIRPKKKHHWWDRFFNK